MPIVRMPLAGDRDGLRIPNDEYGTKLIVMAVAEPIWWRRN